MTEVVVLLLLAVGVISIIAIANIRDLLEDIRDAMDERLVNDEDMDR